MAYLSLESDWPQDLVAFTAFDGWWVALLASLAPSSLARVLGFG
jgi:hypothetical protein